MHGQSGALVEGGIALGMVENAINAYLGVSANISEVNHGSPLVKFPCVVYKKKASVNEEGQEIAEVTSHDFWQANGKNDGWPLRGGLKGELPKIRYVQGQVGQEKSNTEATAIAEGSLVKDNSIQSELLGEVYTQDDWSEEISGVTSQKCSMFGC